MRRGRAHDADCAAHGHAAIRALTSMSAQCNRSCDWGDHLNDLGGTHNAGTLEHRKPQTRRNGWPEVRDQRMEPDSGLLARVEPPSLSGLKGQRRVMPVVMELGGKAQFER
jgi:hypothetical protein